jgi:hypothetical protein
VRVLLARDFASPDYSGRMRLILALVRGSPGDPAADAARLGVSHLVVTPALLADAGVTLAELDERPYLRQVHLTGDPRGEYVALFAIGRRPM